MTPQGVVFVFSQFRCELAWGEGDSSLRHVSLSLKVSRSEQQLFKRRLLNKCCFIDQPSLETLEANVPVSFASLALTLVRSRMRARVCTSDGMRRSF